MPSQRFRSSDGDKNISENSLHFTETNFIRDLIIECAKFLKRWRHILAVQLNCRVIVNDEGVNRVQQGVEKS